MTRALLLMMLWVSPGLVARGTSDPIARYTKAKSALERGDVPGFRSGHAWLEHDRNDPRSQCLAGILNGMWAMGTQDYGLAIRTLQPLEGSARTVFGDMSAPHLDVLTFLSWSYGYAGDLDNELRINQDLLAHYRTDSVRYGLEIVDTGNTIAMNLGMRGDRLTEMRMLQDGLALLGAIEAKGGARAARIPGLRWTLMNSYAISAIGAGMPDQARIAARQCLALMDQLDPASTRQAISEQVVARAWWQVERDIDSCLHYMDRALIRLDTTSRPGQPGRGSPPWLSFMAYRADLQLQAGRAEDALATCATAEPLLQPGVLSVPAFRESALKLLLTRVRALLATGRASDALRSSSGLRATLHDSLMQRDLLALHWATTHMHALEATGDTTAAFALADSIVGHHRLLDTGGGERPASSFNTSYVEVLVHVGRLHLRHGRFEHALPCLRAAVDMHLQNQLGFFATGTDELVGATDHDPVEALLEALSRVKDEHARVAAEAAQVLARTKGALLHQHLRQEEQWAALLPPEEERERLRLRSAVFTANSAYLDAPGTAQADSLLRAEAVYSAHLAELRRRHPALSDPHDLTVACDLRDVAVREHATVLDLYLGSDALFAVRATAKDLRLERRPRPADLLSGLADLRAGALSSDAWARGTPPMDWAWTLRCRQLLLDGLVDPGTDHLIVIPHRELFLLNLELLPGLQDPERFLIEELAVRYELGAAMLCRPSGITAPLHRPRVGAFSASTFEALPPDAMLAEARTRGGLFDLDGVVREAELVAGLLGGEHIAHATAGDLLRRAPEFDILHIGTHGFALPDGTGNSFLLFEGRNGPADRVTRSQVAGMALHSHLVVLSACNTGLGPLRGGEGAASLARAFVQAGCRTVVSSLWQVPDEGTSGIMIDFYRHLSRGLSRSEALRQAKLDHLRAHPDDALRQPYHWAGFVLIGEPSPLFARPWYRRPGWWAALAAALVAAAFVYRRRRSSAARG